MDLFPQYCSVIKYLDKCSHIKMFEDHLIKTFRGKKRPVCVIPVYLALHDLLEESGPSLMFAVYRFSKLEKLLQEIIFCLAVEIDILSCDDDINSITVEVIFTDILCIPEIQYNKSYKFTKDCLTVIEGVVIGITHVHSFTKAVLYSCPEHLCPGNNNYFIQHTTDIYKRLTRFQCKFCHTDLREEMEKRLFSKRVEFLLLPNPETGSEIITLNRSVKCTVCDKLISKLKFGRRCFISGVPHLKKADRSYQWEFKVYGIEDSFISSMDPWKCVLTTVVENLPNYVRAYEFGIAFTFAFMFLDNVTKPGTFFLLKWLLLLLLVQNEFTEPDEKLLFSQVSCRPPALLLVGPLGDNLSNNLLRAAGQFSKPFCEHKPGSSIPPTSLEVDFSGSKKPNVKCLWKTSKKQNTLQTKSIELDKLCTNEEQTVMCGTIELASGGIAYFPNLEFYKKKELTSLVYALENMTVGDSYSRCGVDLTSVHKVSEELFYPNETTIWATVEVNPLQRKKVEDPIVKLSQNYLSDTDIFIETMVKTNEKCTNLLLNGNLKRVIHAFDIVVNIQEASGPIKLMDGSIADFCLSATCNLETVKSSGKSSLPNMKIYSSLLDTCKKAPTVKMEENASKLLQVYYLAMRRSSVRDRKTAPASALPTLFKLAKSNAKINGRIVANELDATVSIYIYDTFIPNQTGTDYLGSKSFHYITGMEQESLEELNNILESINKQLKDLINVAMDEM
ncbi:unnamed protein product [Schistosoma bovis]|nr:unnamed protein product [Schistosoma bovis]